MNIISHELYKLIHTKMFIFVAICALILNVYISASQNFGMYCPAKEYKEYYALADGKTFKEAYDYSVARRDNMFAGWDNGKWAVRSMMNTQIEHLKAVAGYKSYLKSIDDTAQSMTVVSIFADPDSFAYRNIVKTPHAYDSVRSVQPTFAPSKGVLLTVENTASDILLLFVVFTAVTVVFYKDRESRITGLIKPLRYGRERLALAKTATIFTTCLCAEAVIFIMNLCIGALRFGLGDLSRPVQSLEGFLGCNMKISVSGLLWLTFWYKLFAIFVYALIAQCLFIKLKNTTAYLILLTAGGIETALYLLISETSYLSPVKQINLAAFVNSSHLFKTYSNINLLGYPVNLIGTTTLFLAVLTAALIIPTVRLYRNISISEIKKAHRRLIRIKPPKRLFAYSLHKELVMHKGLLILVAAIGFQTYTTLNYVRPYSQADSCYQSYANAAYEKANSQEVYEYITNEYKALQKAMMTPSNQFGGNDLSAKLSGLQKLISQYQRAYDAADGRNLQHYMYYTTPFDEMFGVNGLKSDYKLGLIAILAICLAISPLIAYDNRARIGFLLYTTKEGKRTYLKHNAIIAALFAAFLALAIYVPHYVHTLMVYGSQGLFEPVTAISGFGKLSGLSVLDYMILLTVYRVVSLIVFAEVVLLISYKSKSPTTATITTLAAFALPIVIYLAGAEFIVWVCWRVSGNREMIKIT